MFEVGKSYVNTQSGKVATCVYINDTFKTAILEGKGGLYTPPTNSPYWRETRSYKYWVCLVEHKDGYNPGIMPHCYYQKPTVEIGTRFGSGGVVIAIQEHEWVENNV